MADGSNAPLSDSRLAIEIDGRRNKQLVEALFSLDIIEAAEGVCWCTACFGNWGGPDRAGFQQFGRDPLEFGKTIKIKLEGACLFEGRISAITAHFPQGEPPQVGVNAEDRLQDLRMTRRTRCFSDASLADVVSRIANEHGLSPQLDLNGPRYRILAQTNQSDLAFLHDVARREDAQIWVEGAKLHAGQRARRNGGTLELDYEGRLREFSVGADLAHQRTQLTASGWNVGDKRVARYSADEQAIRSELGNDIGGASTLQRAFGARQDTIAHGAPGSDAEARALAEASMRHLARRFVTGRGVAETDAALRAGAKLRLRGLGPLFEGEYTVTEVRHRFDALRGLRSEFCCDRPGLGQGR